MLKIRDIRQVQVELTTRCNARCPMCMRNYRGMDYNSGYPDVELSLDQFRQIFKTDFLTQLDQGVSFNGNLGDFAVAQDALEIAKWLRSHQVPVYINSNGSLRSADWWSELGRLGVTVGFALDGLEDTHSLYRQDTNWHTVIRNAQAFITAGGRAIWRFIPFDHNRHQESACRTMADKLGFVRFENIDEGRNRGPVFDRSGKFSHHLGQPYDTRIPDIKPMLESHVTWFDSKTVKSDKDTSPLKIICQHKRQQELYLAADGTVWPCCFLAFYPGQMAHPGNEQLLPLVHENSALEYDLEHCMAWFDRVEETWARDSIADGRLYGCVNSCGGRT